jgi:hypothetical protein
LRVKNFDARVEVDFVGGLQMKLFLVSLMLSAIVSEGISFQATSPHTSAQTPTGNLIGRWQVKFNLRGVGEKNLVFDSRAKGSGTFLLLDAEPDDKPATASLSAAWSRNLNDRISFSGEVELPIGTCCRETGTLIFKGNFDSSDSIAGKAIFVTSTTDEENIIGFRSTVGTFTATRVPAKPSY